MYKYMLIKYIIIILDAFKSIFQFKNIKVFNYD